MYGQIIALGTLQCKQFAFDLGGTRGTCIGFRDSVQAQFVADWRDWCDRAATDSRVIVDIEPQCIKLILDLRDTRDTNGSLGLIVDSMR